MHTRYGVILVAGLVLMEGVSLAQKKPQTDAERDDLAGPVKSVATTVTQFHVQWQQLDGPTLAPPIFCHDCDYDPDGTRTRSGQVGDSGFLGENLQIRRGDKGNVIERRATDAVTGEVRSDELLGPYGITQRRYYDHGVISISQKFEYDENGI